MTLPEMAAICQRLAETQQNLPVPLTWSERLALRAAAKALREFADQDLRAPVNERAHTP